MATIVNNPPPGDGDGGSGMLLAAVLIIGVVLIMGYFLLPMLRQAGQLKAPTINVPDKVDININQPEQ